LHQVGTSSLLIYMMYGHTSNTIILFGKKLRLQVVEDTDWHVRPSPKLICVAHTRDR